MNNEGRSWRSLGHTERLKNGVFGTDIKMARSDYYEKVLMCTKEEGGPAEGSETSELSKFSDAEEQIPGTAAGSVVSSAFKSAASDNGDEGTPVSGTMQKLKLSTPELSPERMTPSRETPGEFVGTTPVRAAAGNAELPFPTSNSYNNLLFTEEDSSTKPADAGDDELGSVYDDFDASQVRDSCPVAFPYQEC
jgi:hypothetical protein